MELRPDKLDDMLPSRGSSGPYLPLDQVGAIVLEGDERVPQVQ